MRHVLVLAGGSGTRLWPYSTAALPKQLVPLFGGRSLLDLAVERAQSCVPSDRVWLGTGEGLRSAVQAVRGLQADRLVIEPSARDTLPAVALGCAVLAARDPDAVVAVLTADHVISPVEEFSATLSRGFALAEQHDEVLVTFGVVPDHAATGFGYLELGDALTEHARRVTRFREKPAAALAGSFLDQGPDRYLWNSGMFVWRAQALLDAVEAFQPGAGESLRVLGAAYGTPDWPAAAESHWERLPRTSVDVGVMEPASTSGRFTVAALPLMTRWLDVGSWPAYGEAVGVGDDGNAVAAARALLPGSAGNVVVSDDPDHLVALVGCSGLVVVHTARATLVVPAVQAQAVKDLHRLVQEHFPELA